MASEYVKCDCGETVSRLNLTKHKKSNQHKDIMSNATDKHILCECGMKINKSFIKIHQTSKKHTELLENGYEQYKINRNKERWIKYKEKMSAKSKEKITCPCGSIICRRLQKIHLASQKHQNYLKTQTKDADDTSKDI